MMEDKFYLPLKVAPSLTQLGIIANQIANIDDLVNRSKEQGSEIIRLKIKMKSLKESAIHVKGLYEHKCKENKQLDARINELNEKIQLIQMQCYELEHSKINSELTFKQAYAEFENKQVSSTAYYKDMLVNLIEQCKESLKAKTCEVELPSMLEKALQTLNNHKEKLNATENFVPAKRKKKSCSSSDKNRLNTDNKATIFDEPREEEKLLEGDIVLEQKLKKINYTSTKTQTDADVVIQKSTVATNTTQRQCKNQSTNTANKTNSKSTSTFDLNEEMKIKPKRVEVSREIEDILCDVKEIMSELCDPIFEGIIDLRLPRHVSVQTDLDEAKETEIEIDFLNACRQIENNVTDIVRKPDTIDVIETNPHLKQNFEREPVSCSIEDDSKCEDVTMLKTCSDSENEPTADTSQVDACSVKDEDIMPKKPHLSVDSRSSLEKNTDNPTNLLVKGSTSSLKRKQHFDPEHFTAKKIDTLDTIKSQPGGNNSPAELVILEPKTNLNHDDVLADDIEISANEEPFESPSSPPPVQDINTESVPEIPLTYCKLVLKRKSSESPLKSIVQSQKMEKKLKLQDISKEDTKLVKLTNDINVLFGTDFNSLTARVCILNNTKEFKDPKYYSKSILDLVEKGANCDKTMIFVNECNKFIENFKDYIVFDLGKRMFSLNKEKAIHSITSLSDVAHFFVRLTMTQLPAKKSTCRLFIFKALYYFTYKAYPIIYTVLSTYPQCLPKQSEAVDDSLVLTIKCILMNSKKDDRENPDFKKVELRRILIQFHGYTPWQPTQDETINELINLLKNHQFVNVDYSLILLCKRNGFDWALESIVKPHLYPMLNKNLSLVEKNPQDIQQMIICMFTISSILKTAPIEKDMATAIQIFSSVLKTSDDAQLQEAAVEALLRLSRFGHFVIYQHINSWHPKHQISNKLYTMLRTFIFRKPKYIWSKLDRF